MPTLARSVPQWLAAEARLIASLLETRFDERNGVISPDGRWLAYESDNSGRFEVYVRPFPNVGGGQWQVSPTGGTRPLWARSGRKLFYVAPEGALMVIALEPVRDGGWHAGPPVKLLDRGYVMNPGNVGRNYDISPDGRRFLLIKPAHIDQATASPQLVVVQHFDQELKRLVPTK